MKTKLTAVVVMLVFACSALAWSETNTIEVNKIDVTKDDEATLSQVLMKNAGKVVSIRFKSGEEMTGKVVVVSKGLLHLAELKGRDFFDAVIEMDSISAVILPVRGVKRN